MIEDDLKNILSSYSVSDAATKATVNEVFNQYNYTLDPHGAVGYYALIDYLGDNVKNSSGGGITGHSEQEWRANSLGHLAGLRRSEPRRDEDEKKAHLHVNMVAISERFGKFRWRKQR